MGSTGGTDIIGIVLTSKNPNFSVGRFALMFNAVIYAISGFFYGIPIMIYSIMYSVIENISLDKLHEQNISSSAIIFSKKKPKEILKVLENVEKRIANKEFYGYSGIVEPEEISKSNSIRLSSIPKGEIPICYMTYNQDGYTVHCKKYKEYKEWEAKRNPVRYESNLGHNYDAKNIMHCMRLIRMAKELAQGKGFNVVRTDDRDYLLAIRNHTFEYEEIMEHLKKEKQEMEEAIKHSTLPDNSDFNAINRLLINIRENIY